MPIYFDLPILSETLDEIDTIFLSLYEGTGND